ncbi:HD domain-containing protein [Pararobbsia silviterrae]|uniref:HD domain-containing protein n=1 Tax=Pararobbsia silviterrae TaxID=1792498 RepID=A0A494XFX9_9BURK|nr:HD domain-containing protein [Pararobbsia silviterrae]RKP49667.1 HD domain-containing protein [Pararobbsia silviterrae]
MSIQLVPPRVAGIDLPDSALAVDATTLAYESCDRFLFHHVVRTYVFGALLAQRRGLTFDAELVYVSAVLHDLGLTQRFETPDRRFEVDGAFAAHAFMHEHGQCDCRARKVWDAVALHSSFGIASYMEPDIAIVHLGTSVDGGGYIDEIGRAVVDEVNLALPRLGYKKAMLDALVGVATRKPQTAFGNVLSDIGRLCVHGFKTVNVVERIAASPFED